MALKVAAISWFRAEDWPKWLELDPEMQPTFQGFLEKMNRQLPQLEAQGVKFKKITIDPDKFKAWATANKQDFGTKGRSAYVAYLAHQGDQH